MARRLALTLNGDDLTTDDLALFTRQATGEAFGRQPLAFQILDDEGRPVTIKGRAVLMTGVIGAKGNLTATQVPMATIRGARNGIAPREVPAPADVTIGQEEGTTEEQTPAPDITAKLDAVKAKGRAKAPVKAAPPAAEFAAETPAPKARRTRKAAAPTQ